jgi:hypothetical protein
LKLTPASSPSSSLAAAEMTPRWFRTEIVPRKFPLGSVKSWSPTSSSKYDAPTVPTPARANKVEKAVAVPAIWSPRKSTT